MTFRNKERNVLSIALALSTLLWGCRGPVVLLPGGALDGATVPPPTDWSFTDEIEVLQLETQPADPYSVNVWVIALNEGLYVHSGSSHTAWVENMEADPRVRIKANESVYGLVATRVVSQDEFDRFISAYEEKYGSPPRNSDIGDVYLFRLETPDSAL